MDSSSCEGDKNGGGGQGDLFAANTMTKIERHDDGPFDADASDVATCFRALETCGEAPAWARETSQSQLTMMMMMNDDELGVPSAHAYEHRHSGVDAAQSADTAATFCLRCGLVLRYEAQDQNREGIGSRIVCPQCYFTRRPDALCQWSCTHCRTDILISPSSLSFQCPRCRCVYRTAAIRQELQMKTTNRHNTRSKCMPRSRVSSPKPDCIGAPRLPASALAWFSCSSAALSGLRTAQEYTHNKEINKNELFCAMWNELDEQKRQKYHKLAVSDKARYRQQIMLYRHGYTFEQSLLDLTPDALLESHTTSGFESIRHLALAAKSLEA